jgi:hypothetical protein
MDIRLQDVLQMHMDAFGVEPIITGAEAMSDVPLIERIYAAIEANKPYIEKAVSENELI